MLEAMLELSELERLLERAPGSEEESWPARLLGRVDENAAGRLWPSAEERPLCSAGPSVELRDEESEELKEEGSEMVTLVCCSGTEKYAVPTLVTPVVAFVTGRLTLTVTMLACMVIGMLTACPEPALTEFAGTTCAFAIGTIEIKMEENNSRRRKSDRGFPRSIIPTKPSIPSTTYEII